LLTGFEGLDNNNVPCTEVLSVAGLLDVLCLVLLGKEVYSEENYLPDNLGFMTFRD